MREWGRGWKHGESRIRTERKGKLRERQQKKKYSMCTRIQEGLVALKVETI